MRFTIMLASLLPACVAAAEVGITTHTFKQVGSLEIKLDAHRLNDDAIRPLAVWIHGGALVNGGRQDTWRFIKPVAEAGYCVASLDYRLAPETKLPHIIEDIEDAFRWLRENGRERLQADPRKIAVLGASAGGCLTLTAGFRVKPRPTVLVSFWGYGDLVGPWVSKPSPHERHLRVVLDDAEMAVIEAGPAVANAKDRTINVNGYTQTSRRHGRWPLNVAGFDPVKERDKFVPYMAALNVTSDYPPTLMIHGTADTDVPYEQSWIMAREFEKHGVPHRLIPVEGGEHALSTGAKSEDIEAAYAAVLPFINKYMSQ